MQTIIPPFATRIFSEISIVTSKEGASGLAIIFPSMLHLGHHIL